jgi:hypothetical protein
MADAPKPAFLRFQEREARREAAEAAHGRWMWRLLALGLFAICAGLAAHDAAAAWRMLRADPAGLIHAARHAPRENWRGLALISAGAFDLICAAWLLSPAGSKRDPELPLSLASIATLGALEFDWLTASRAHLEIGVGIAVVGLVLTMLPAGRKPTRKAR